MTPAPQPSPTAQPWLFWLCQCRGQCVCPRRGERLLLHYFYPPCSELCPRRRMGQREEAGAQSHAGSGTPPWWPSPPVRPHVQPGRSPITLSCPSWPRPVRRWGGGTWVPVPRVQDVTPVSPLPAPQAAQILPSSSPGIQAVPAVAGDMPHGLLVPSTVPEVPMGRHIPCILVTRPGTSPCAFGWGISSCPTPLPHSALCGTQPGLPQPPGDTGAAWGHCACPNRAASVAVPGPSPRPPCSWDLLSKSRKK